MTDTTSPPGPTHRPQTVALFVQSLSGGGAERNMLRLAKGLAERGYNVTVVATDTSSAVDEWLDDDLAIVDLKVRWFPTAFVQLARWIRRNRPQVLISALSAANAMAVVARSLARTQTRVVVTERNTPSIQRADVRGFRRRYVTPWMMRRTYPHADAVVGVSSGVADDVATFVSLDRAAITWIPNPVADRDIVDRAAEPLGGTWPQKIAGRRLIVSVGRLEPHKNHVVLLDAFASVSERHSDATLVVVGDGPLRDVLEQRADELFTDGKVVFTGFQSNPYSWMARAQVVVLASRYEGLPTVLIEALACGAQVVSTDCPSGPAEVLDGGKWGKLVPVDNAEALAAAIIDALDDGRWDTPPHDALAAYRPAVVLDQWESLINQVTSLGR